MVTVPSGQMVEIRDVAVDEDYQVWEKVSAEVKGMVYEGYIPRDYLACSDERFLEWEELYGMNPGAAVMLAEENATVSMRTSSSSRRATGRHCRL